MSKIGKLIVAACFVLGIGSRYGSPIENFFQHRPEAAIGLQGVDPKGNLSCANANPFADPHYAINLPINSKPAGSN